MEWITEVSHSKKKNNNEKYKWYNVKEDFLTMYYTKYLFNKYSNRKKEMQSLKMWIWVTVKNTWNILVQGLSSFLLKITKW